jgi:ureidoacrylate peracid hydrolase
MQMFTPILINIDIQREYTTPGRPFYLNGIEPSLSNCRLLLDHARKSRWPVIHVRHLQTRGHLFDEAMEFSRFVEGFEPLASEPVFTKAKLSCYSDEGFARMMESAYHDQVYIAGYNSLMCCLSTLVDAYHRGHRLNFVADASLARATRHADEQGAHVHATDILSIYANVVSTGKVLAIRREGELSAAMEAAE